MAEYIRYQGNIFILESSRAYRHEVIRYLDLIKTTGAGRTLLKAINECSGQWLAIRPFNPSDDDPVNAYAYPKSEEDAAPENYLRTVNTTFPDSTEMNLPIGVGSGKGSDSYIDFHPAAYREKSKRMGRLAPGDGPGEVLFHETVHALRMMTGKLLNQREKVPGHAAMDDVEEFHSILAANVYRSERGFKALRKDHHGKKRLEAGLSQSDAYYAEFKTQIKGWFTTQSDFCLAMAYALAVFNPFRTAAVDLGLMSSGQAAMLVIQADIIANR